MVIQKHIKDHPGATLGIASLFITQALAIVTTPLASAQSLSSKTTIAAFKYQDKLKSNPIIKDIQIVVNFLSAAVGLVVLGVIVLGGVQYIMAGDKPETVSAAKKRIVNGLTALLIYLVIVAFLQWLVPGGVFN